MTRPQYRVWRLRAKDGALAGWGVFCALPGDGPCMAAGFTGRFAGFRAKRHASALNRKG